MVELRVGLVVLESGERLPLLIGEEGVPLFRPTVWLMTMRRAANRATATLQANLFALKVLYSWAAVRDVNLEGRMIAGEYLQSHELASLADAARWFLLDRDRSGGITRQVETSNAANRLRTIGMYLRWLTQEGIFRQERGATTLLLRMRDEMLVSLGARTPKASRRNVLGRREAPPPEAMERLLSVIDLDAPENPWADIGLRVRNRLLIHVLLGMGVRRGEALGLKVENIDLRQNQVLIARNADDPLDPRRQQPLAKTLDRILPIEDSLAEMLRHYIVYIRSKFLKARRHPFLFVSHQDGSPLALNSANKVLRTLREKVPGLPSDLSPHLLRHAWNDAFSQRMDTLHVDHAREEQLRSAMMGWKPQSGTSALYNVRHVRKAAEALSIKGQEDLNGRRDG